MSRQVGSWVIAIFLFGCGGDDEGGGDAASDTACAMGITVSGDFEGSLDMNDDQACIVSFSIDSGIDAGFATLSAGFSPRIGIGDVMEGQTGAGFPTEIALTIDDGPSYSTSQTGCSATITEHELLRTRTDELGEERDYHVVGTATCTEPALREDGMAGQITLSNVTFEIPAIWTD
jgi:hypothetical protein